MSAVLDGETPRTWAVSDVQGLGSAIMVTGNGAQVSESSAFSPILGSDVLTVGNPLPCLQQAVLLLCRQDHCSCLGPSGVLTEPLTQPVAPAPGPFPARVA